MANAKRMMAAVATVAVFALGATATNAAEPKLMASNCTVCHGVGGKSAGHIPDISGLSAQDIGQLMRAFKAGEADVTIMNRIAGGYTDAEIDALAAELVRNR